MKKTWKRSEGLLDRYFGFQRKIGINKKRGKETERRKTFRDGMFFLYGKRKTGRFLLESRQKRLLSTKTGSPFSVQSLISCCYGISDLWGVYIFLLWTDIFTKFNFCNVLFLPYFIYSVSVLLFMENLI